jgi:hypothetical protein
MARPRRDVVEARVSLREEMAGGDLGPPPHALWVHASLAVSAEGLWVPLVSYSWHRCPESPPAARNPTMPALGAYPAADTRAKAKAAIRETLACFLEAHPDSVPTSEVRVTRIAGPHHRNPLRPARAWRTLCA